MTFYAFELARREVGDEADLLAYQRLRVGVELGDAADDCAGTHSVLNLELEQFIGFRHLAAFQDGSHADVHTSEVVDGYRRFYLGGFPCVEGILFLGLQQFVDLGLDGLVAYLLEKELGLLNGVAFHEEVGVTGILPAHGTEVHDAVHLVGREGQERSAEDGQIGANLQREVHHRGGALGVGLDEFPRLGVGEVFVAQSGEVHHLGEGFAETVGLDGTAYTLGISGYFFDDFLLQFGHRATGRYFAAVELVGQHKRTVDEVAKDSDQLEGIRAAIQPNCVRC